MQHFKLPPALCSLLVLLTLAPLSAGQNRGISLFLPPSGNLRVENPSGGLNVRVWDRNIVELTTVSERAENKDLPISVEYSADTLLVRSREGSRSLDLVLNVPPRTNLMLSTVRGPIKIDGQTAAISARTGQGDITVQLDEPHNADIKATATKGAVDLLGRPQTGSLEKVLGAGTRKIQLASEAGEIKLLSNKVLPKAIVKASQPKIEEVDENEVIKVNTHLVTLNVSVLDRRSGRGVSGLTRNDLKVYEDNVEQQIVQFDSSNAPFDLLLLLDLSGSTARVTNIIRDAAIRFISTTRAQDRIAVFAFAENTRIISELSSDRDLLRKRVRSMESPAGETRLYDALKFSIEYLKRSSDDKRRKGIVLLSDGLDSILPGVTGTGSTTSFEQVRQSIQEFDGILYSIWTNTEYEAFHPSDIQPETFDSAYDTMVEISESGGGVFYEIEKLEDLAGAYERVVKDLSTLYTVSYHPSRTERDGQWRAIRLALPTLPNGVARSRRGYYANP